MKTRQLTRPTTLLLMAGLLAAGAATALDTEEKTFDSDGVQIRYITQGQGEPLVLIHGFTANAEANWVMPGIFGKLAEAFQVIAIDARGHGKSGKPHDPADYGDQMVQDVINLLDHLEIDKAHVGGYSMGGFLTMKLVTSHPDRLLSAIVGAAGWQPAGAPADPNMTALAESLEKGEGIAPLIHALHPPEDPPLAPEQIAMMNQMVIGSNDQAALAAVVRGMGDLNVTEIALRKNEVPTIAIIGSKDPLKTGVDAMDGVMENLSVVVIDGGDHMSTLMNPTFSQQFADAALGFLIELCKCA